MKFAFIVVVAASLLSIGASSVSFADTYTIDKDHSTAGFSIRHLISKVSGNFNDFSGTIEFDEKNPSKGSVDADIKIASIDTHVEKRNEHLKSPDFFDAAKYPDMTFKSTKIIGSGKKFKVTGTLSLHGVDKPVTLDVEYGGTTKDPWGNTRAGFAAKTKINRKDFGLSWNKELKPGELMVGDNVDIDLEIEAIKKAPEKTDAKADDKATGAGDKPAAK